MLEKHDFLHVHSYSAYMYIYNKTVSWFYNQFITQILWNQLSNN